MGQTVELNFHEKTGAVWFENDIPLLKRQLAVRLSIMGIIFIVLIISSYIF